MRDEVPFADHHPYTAADMTFLQGLAARDGARLVTTAKDHVRLPPQARAAVAVLPVKAVFETPEALDALLAPIFKRTAP